MRPKVLIIDDDRDIVDAMEAILSLEEYVVPHAYNGKSGIEKVKEERPDVILLDYMLPDMTGKDVVRSLKEDDEVKNIPIIIVSAARDIKEVARQLDVVSVLEKPFDMHALLRTVHTHLP